MIDSMIVISSQYDCDKFPFIIDSEKEFAVQLDVKKCAACPFDDLWLVGLSLLHPGMTTS